MTTKTLKRLAKRYLKTKGIQICPVRYDFDSFFVSESARARVIGDTAQVVQDYMSEQRAVPIAPDLDFTSVVEEFFDVYRANPAKTGGGGCGFNSLIWLYTIVRGFMPRLVVESGSYEGGSAWTMRRAAPAAEMHCFDIDLSRLLVPDDSIAFHEFDWTAFQFDSVDPERSICFFDDHCDQVVRLLQAHALGFKYLIFDDNTHFNSLYLARAGAATLELLFDDRLENGRAIEWRMLGDLVSYTPNMDQFRKARGLIRTYERVPSLHAVNGCEYSTPLTVVALDTGDSE